MAQTRENVSDEDDAPPIPEYNPVDDIIPFGSDTSTPVSGDKGISSDQSAPIYAEISTKSAATF